MENNYELIHNEAEAQYEFHIEGHLARLLYKEEDGVMHLTNTYVPEELGGRGIAGALTKAVCEEIQKKGLKMKPACSYIVNYIEKHPEYENLQA